MSFIAKFFGRKKTVPSDNPPLFLIGLGNPGKKYQHTRHNLGFLTVEWLREEWSGSEWRREKKFQAEISEATLKGRKVYFVKPQAFMNNSGETVRALLDFYKVSPKELVVLHDEVDIPFGKLKTTLSSRAAGHNGVKDIIEKLGTQDFRRFRLGVGKPVNPNISTADHVLQNFSATEWETLPVIFVEVKDLLEVSH